MAESAPALAVLLDHAADAVAAVRAGRSLTDFLDAVPATVRPGTQALAFQAMRRLGTASAVRAHLAPKTPPPAVDALLSCALALLADGADAPYAEYTLVDQAVAAMRRRAPAAAGFVNAVLRRFTRERESVLGAVRTDPVAAFDHPLWWIERFKRDWPASWQALLEQAQRRPPMTLRVNARRSDAAATVQRLGAAGLGARAVGASAVVLAQPCPVERLPGFGRGEVSVQDLAAQRAAPLLLGGGLRRGARVLDACAAPGGKAAHLLELADVDLTALDVDPRRLARVQATLARLQLPAAGSTVRCLVADARDVMRWWDGQAFDAIMLDAPCSGSGVVRRHPDVRWLRRPDDIAALARLQAQLLDALWPLLAPGGRLMYATCSLFKAEGSEQVDAFLQRCGGSQARLDPASPGHLLPLPDNHLQAAEADGFYYALIHKTDKTRAPP